MENQLSDRKEELLKASQEYQDSLNEDFNILGETAINWGGKLLSIGGGVLISYIVYRKIFGSTEAAPAKGKEKVVRRSNVKKIFLKSLSDKVAIILLEILREYLIKRIGKTSVNEERGDL